MWDSLLNAEDCSKILKINSPCAKFLQFSIKSLVEEVEGYLSSHFTVKIIYQNENDEEKHVNFFMKTLNKDNGFLTEFAKELQVFTKEIFFYKLYSELQKISKFLSFAPKCFLCKDNLIVIENMINSDFYVKDNHVSYNIEESKMALKTLALYHATSIAYEEQKSKELAKIFRLNLEFPKELKDTILSTDENSVVFRYFKTSNKVILSLAEIVPNIDKDNFKRIIKNENDTSITLRYLKKYRQCLIHCDLWTKNIMFKKINNIITDCRLIDFQLLKYGLPGYDVCLLLHANTSSEFRKTYKDELLQYYYNCLASKLENYGVDCCLVISLQDFLDGVILYEPSAKLFAFNYTTVNLAEEVMQEANENPNLMEDYLIEKRLQLLLKHYHENRDVRKWVDDEFKELDDVLVLKRLFLNNC